MADTGSEIAEGTTRGTTGMLGRMLERRFMMRDTAHGQPTKASRAAGEVGGGNVEIGIRCPKDDFDARAEEVLEALERGRTGITACGMDESRLTVAVPRDQGEQALRAFERLSASARSAFSIDDVEDLDVLEQIAGRRALGSKRHAPRHEDTRQGTDTPVESVALTFANHPEEPETDTMQARAFARRMRALGFDAAHRPVELVRRDASGEIARERSEVVGISYLAPERDHFLDACGVALHEVGAAGPDDPFAGDRVAYQKARDALMADAEARRESFERNREAAAEASLGKADKRNDQRTGPAADMHHTLTAEEYKAMPARERAKIAPERIPEDAFGTQRVREAMHEQAGVARAMRRTRAPERTHPSIGER